MKYNIKKIMVSTEVISRTLTLNNGLIMPILGLGTYRIKETRPVINAIQKYNYRWVDSAAQYKNETIIGDAFT